MSSEESRADLKRGRRLGLGSAEVVLGSSEFAESFVILHPILSPAPGRLDDEDNAPGRLDHEDKVTDLLVTDKVMDKVMEKRSDVADKRSDDQDQLDLPGFGGGYNSFGAKANAKPPKAKALPSLTVLTDASVLDGGCLPYQNGITPYTQAGSADFFAATAKCIAGVPPRYMELEAPVNAGLPRGDPHLNQAAVGHGVPEDDSVPSPTRPSRCV